MAQKFTTLDDLFSEEEEKRVEQNKINIAAEKAAWDALPQAEKDRINAERDKFWEDFGKAVDEHESSNEDDSDEEENDE